MVMTPHSTPKDTHSQSHACNMKGAKGKDNDLMRLMLLVKEPCSEATGDGGSSSGAS